MKISQLTADIRTRLTPQWGAGEAAWIVRIIFGHLKGWSQADLLVHGDDEADSLLLSGVEMIMERLDKGEPIQYITGDTYWHGLTLKVNRSVLIPRPETSQLVDLITDRMAGRDDLRVLDLCTGSGCIILALGRGLKFPTLTAVDISSDALEVARDNARQLGVKVDFIQADVLGKLPLPDASFDLIVSNPPYVLESERAAMERNVLDYEPAQALFVPDNDPVKFYRAIAGEAARLLVPGGALWFEINPLCADKVAALLNDAGFDSVEIINDSYGKRRFISAILP